MKKIYSILFLLCFFSVSKAQYVQLFWPTSMYLSAKYPGCFDASQTMLDTTCAAIINEDTLIFNNLQVGGLDIRFVRYFKNLKYLDISNDELSSLTGVELPSTLESLLCHNQHIGGELTGGILSDLPVLPSGLKKLVCGTSRITNWPSVWPPSLEYLDISNNILSSLPVLPPGLKYLNCSDQRGIAGGVGNNSYPIMDTILSLPAGLTHLICSSTSLSALPTLPSTLIYLDCSYNDFYIEVCTTGQCVPVLVYSNPGIQSLPNWPPHLEYLDASQRNNGFPQHEYAFAAPTTFPATLVDLSIDSISPQTILPAGLKYLKTGLRGKCLPYLPASLGSGQSPYRSTPYNLYLNNVYWSMCIPNAVPGMQVNPSTTPYCTVSNNPNNCASNPTIAGFIFYDLNSNGIQDPGENPRGGVKATNNNGIVGFSGIDGVYEIQGNLGNNVTTITAPSFYNAVPASINHTLTSAVTVVRDTVALQPNVIIDSMRITITPMGPARRGWDLPYQVKYENVGTTTVNANIVISYNNSLLSHISGPLTLALNNVGPGDRGEFTTTFIVNSSAAFGAEVHTTATITAGTSTSIDHSYTYVIFSYDPNAKHATPTLTAEQINSGEFIDYLVRFQNIGTDTAFNITITDKLSADLIANTLQVIEASHACTTTQINDYVNFKFSNILLPDSNVNESASHGYVRFRIKPQQGLANNTNVPNNAAIYFDFNTPVITNDAITIVNFATVPLTLLDFSGMVQPENKVLLTWKTANEINTARYDIEQGNDGRKFTGIASLAAVGRGDNNYSQLVPLPEGIIYYRLKIADIDGSVSYSNVIKISGGKNKAGFILLNNPVKNEININLLDNNLVNTNASIISSHGIIVQTFTLTSGVQHINISNLAPGLYFIRTKNGTEKIVISK